MNQRRSRGAEPRPQTDDTAGDERGLQRRLDSTSRLLLLVPMPPEDGVMRNALITADLA
jgi:hypothetical protein